MNRKPSRFIWILYFLHVFVIFDFSNYTSYGYLMAGILCFPLFLQMKKFISYLEINISKKRFIIELILILLLSFIFYMSIFKRLVDFNSIYNYLKAFSRFSLVFVFIYCIYNYLIKVNLKIYEVKNRKYLLLVYAVPSLIIFSIVWMAVYPAIMSPDSVYVWTMVQRGNYDGLHPLLYVLGIKLFTYIWNSPAFIILLQILLCSFTFSYATYRIRSWGTNKWICVLVAIVLPLIPANFMYSVTLWKDIPYTMGLILVSLELSRAVKEKNYYDKKINLIIFGILIFFTMTTRYNAPYVLVFSMIVYIIILLVKKMKKQSIINAIIIILSLIIFVTTTNIGKIALKDNYIDYNTSSSFYALPLQGIIAVYNDAYSELSESQLEKINKYLYLDKVDEHIIEFSENERWRNFTRARRLLNKNAIENDKLEFFNLYFELLLQNPIIVTRSYFNQTAIIWCSRYTSYTSHLGWDIIKMEGLESIEQNIKFSSINKFIYSKFYQNQYGNRTLYWHPACNMLVILLMIYVGLKKKGLKSFIIVLPTLFNSLGYMASIEGQCSRYTYINFTIAIIYSIYILIEKDKVKISNN